MIRVLTKFLGGVILAVVSFLFIVFTASINEAPSMGGPMMMMSPGPLGWFYVVIVMDALLFLFVWLVFKLLGFGWRAIGIWSLLVAVPILALGVRNHINAPPIDLNPTNKMPIPDAMHFILYGVVGILVFAGLWLTKKPD